MAESEMNMNYLGLSHVRYAFEERNFFLLLFPKQAYPYTFWTHNRPSL